MDWMRRSSSRPEPGNARRRASRAAAWENGRRSAKAPDSILPREIAEAVGELRRRWQAAGDDVARENALQPRSISAAVHSRLTALVQIVRSRRHALSEPCFVVQFDHAPVDAGGPSRQSVRRNLTLAKLSVREQEVAGRVVAGGSNRRISAELGKSLATVKAQLSSIYRKVGVASRAGLIVLLK